MSNKALFFGLIFLIMIALLWGLTLKKFGLIDTLQPFTRMILSALIGVAAGFTGAALGNKLYPPQ